VPSFDFATIADVANVEKDGTCDILAVVKEVGEMGTITSKATQREIKKRELTLVDSSLASIRLTLWGKQAESFDAQEHPVIAFRSVKVGDFGGRSLSMVGSSSMLIEPDMPEAHELRGWFDKQGSGAAYQSFSNAGGGGNASGSFKAAEFRTIEQVKAEGLGQSDQPAYFNMRATVIFIRDTSLSYPACPTERCNKKVVMEGNDKWRCEKCDTVHEAPEYRCVRRRSSVQ
jgi:replication factor A1